MARERERERERERKRERERDFDLLMMMNKHDKIIFILFDLEMRDTSKIL